MSDTVPQASALKLAILFHETYERLAPSFGYETRADTKTFDPESKNGRLMVAVCGEIASQAPAAIAESTQNVEAWLDRNTTFYNTNESTVPVLASVSKRIWYHATDDTESYPFSAVIDAARKAGTP